MSLKKYIRLLCKDFKAFWEYEGKLTIYHGQGTMRFINGSYFKGEFNN